MPSDLTHDLERDLDDADGSVASGGFSVDREKAREKLRHFQLAEPTAWLVEALRAAVVLGATRIDVDADTDDVHVRFESRGASAALTRADVDEIYGALLGKNAPPARRHLAAALNGAMALAPRFIRVESTGASGGIRLEMRPDKPDVIDEIARSSGPAVTHIHVRAPFGAGRFVELFKLMAGKKRELIAARSAARYAHIPVHVNGDRVSAPVMSRHRVDVLGRHARGAVFLDAARDDDEGLGRLVLLHRGMVLEELKHDWLPAGVAAVVEPAGLQRDASLNAFIRGPGFEGVLDEVLAAVVTLAESSPEAELLERAALAFAPAVLRGAFTTTIGALPGLSALLGKAGRSLRTVPVFVDHHGRAVTLNELAAELEIRGNVLMSTVPAAVEITLERPVIYVRTDMERAALQRAVGAERMASGAELIEKQEQRARARENLLRRRATTELPPGRYLARQVLDGHVRGEIGVRVHGTPELVATFFVEGALVCTVKMPSPLPGLSVALEAPFRLNADYDGVLPDATLSRAMRHAWAELPSLFDAAAGTYNTWAKSPGDAGVSDANVTAAREPLFVFLSWVIDREGLWRAFAKKNGLDEDLRAPSLPPVELGTARVRGAHELSWSPLLPRVDRSHVALAWLPDVVPVVPHHVTRCSRQDAIRAGDVLRAVLARRGKLEVLDEISEREQRRALLLEKSPDRRAFYRDGAIVQRDGVTSVLSFTRGQGLTLAVHTEGRAVHEVEIARFPAPLRAAVEDPELLPAADGTVAPDDVRRLALQALEGLPRLLLHNPLALEWRPVVDNLLGAIVPHSALRRAASVLEVTPGGVGDYLDLLELSFVAGIDNVAPLVELVLEARDPPTVKNVRAVATTLGTSLPMLTPPTSFHFELLLAAYGGRAHIREATGRTLAEKIVGALPALGSTSFRTLGGPNLDLRSLAAIAAGGKRLRAIPVDLAASDGDPTILVLNGEERRVLKSFLGPIDDASDEVKTMNARRRFEAQTAEPARLDPGKHALVTDIHEGNVRGQLGLVAALQGVTRAHVRVLRGERFVTSLDVSRSAPCSFQAVIDDPDMPMLSDFSAPAHPGHLARLTALCVRAADESIVTLVGHADAERASARLLLLERMSRRRQVPLPQGREDLLLRAPLFESTDGHRMGLGPVLTTARKHNVVRYTMVKTDKRELDRFGVVLGPTVVELSLLSQIAGMPVVDMGAAWDREARLESHKAALRNLPAPPGEPLASTSTAVLNGSIRAWLPKRVETGAASVVHAGLGGLEITATPVDSVLPGAVVVVTIPELVDEGWTTVRLHAVDAQIDVVLSALALAMVNGAEMRRPPDGLRETCRATLMALLRKKQVSERWARVRDRLEELRLFDAASGARITWRQVVDQRPEHYEELLRELLDDDPPPALSARLPVEPAAAPASAPRPPAPLPLPPEQQLEARLKETLQLVQLDGPAAAELARWPVSVERRGGQGPAVELTRKATVVDLDHAFVKLSFTADDEPAAFFMLCAVVYGVVNAHLGEVTDDHERAFLARLLEHAATST